MHVAFGKEWTPPLPADFIRARGRSTSDPLDILYLRLFDNSTGTERFSRAPFRRYSYVYILRSAQQVDADELELAEEAGHPESMFITTAAELDVALAREPGGPHEPQRPKGILEAWHLMHDHEVGLYPVRALLCHGSFWKAAVDILLTRMDYVALDLSGYRPEHLGTRYELQRVIDRVPISRVALAGRCGERPDVPHRADRSGVESDDGRFAQRRDRRPHGSRRRLVSAHERRSTVVTQTATSIRCP